MKTLHKLLIHIRSFYIMAVRVRFTIPWRRRFVAIYFDIAEALEDTVTRSYAIGLRFYFNTAVTITIPVRPWFAPHDIYKSRFRITPAMWVINMKTERLLSYNF